MTSKIQGRKFILTLVYSILVVAPSAASAEMLHYLERSDVREDGSKYCQVARIDIFRNFQGDSANSRGSKIFVNGTQTRSIRSIRILASKNTDNQAGIRIRPDCSSKHCPDLKVAVGDRAFIHYFDTSKLPAPPSSDIVENDSTGYKSWTSSKPLDNESVKDDGFVQFSIYFIESKGTDSNIEYNGKILISAHSASVRAGTVVVGKMLTSNAINLDTDSLSSWSQKDIEVGDSQTKYAPVLVEQAMLPIDDDRNLAHRVRRALGDGDKTSPMAWIVDLLNLLRRTFWGAPQRTHHASLPQIHVVEPSSERPPMEQTAPPVVSVYHAEIFHENGETAFGTAMNMMDCGADSTILDETPEGESSTRTKPKKQSDNKKKRVRDKMKKKLGRLSQDEIESIQTQIAPHRESSSPIREPLSLPGGRLLDGELAQWLAEDPARAIGMLDRATAVLRASGGDHQRNIPVDQLGENDGVLMASCAASGEGASLAWKCVDRAKRAAKKPAPVIAVPASIAVPGRGYYLHGEAGFDGLANQVRRDFSRTLFPGIAREWFNDQTIAIGRDAARPPYNRGIVYIHNVRDSRSSRRFIYGVSHILEPENNGGHRAAWNSLGINSEEQLARLIMSAVTNEDSVWAPVINGRTDRSTRQYMRFTYGGFIWEGKIIIAISDNGSIITAYPDSGVEIKKTPLEM
ncbi:hypothetical protein [Trinickia fusca]|uniref:hypothetical protein n=1 Tax=Trinickia fusca TaxID=2419777 RepID=UPI0011C4267B|nr:hypothetical protein [Trinickia fusca]